MIATWVATRAAMENSDGVSIVNSARASTSAFSLLESVGAAE
jgi:hypothetical protein